ncbi:hypothetical protein [Megamonas funiformis]|jgi:hypothetical protein|uniref:Uncharacterized protein n=1 Tax=Megamonas funiformis YIT 11815 TaxID=742816 RepID=A0ABP2NLM2_9FIRM|nr:hypothetical protein [Megamonas funiformis]EHR38461.1 hypothetical protein HMPREF9454_00766 [Megamonas funiformis YIT 11815]
MMTYEEMKNKHQEEYDTFAKDKIFYIFTSSKEEFEKKLKEYGLNGEDICSIGYGGFIKKKDKEELKNLTQRHRKEKQEAIEQDKDGSGFIKSMFLLELYNHEFAYTYDVEDTLNDLGYTMEQINSNPALKNGLDLAIKAIIKDD